VPAEIVVLGTMAAVILGALRAAGVLRRLTAARDALAHQATHDPLTGIANRTLFSRRLTDVLTDGRQCSVVLIDLDEFKQVNDELGHLAGDALLVEVASRLTRAVRVDDLVARFAGDEFAVLLPDITPEEAQRVINRAAELLNADVVVAGHHMPLRASIGLAHWQASTPGSPAALGQRSDGVNDLLAAADQAMYRDKRQRARHLVLVRPTELVASTPTALPSSEPTVGALAVVTDDAPRLLGGLAGVADS
jgi:diguanylate cyclase (GGDEF)-like protein